MFNKALKKEMGGKWTLKKIPFYFKKLIRIILDLFRKSNILYCKGTHIITGYPGSGKSLLMSHIINNVDKNKYDKLIQFYIFNEKDYNYFRKISIVNYQSKNFYVGSFIYDELDKTIYQSDNVARNDEYKEIYNNFFELLNIKKGQK